MQELAAGEEGRVRVVFNGDFHWFDIDAALFADIDSRVMAQHATRGNVETELAMPGSEAGCGCAYPEWVGDEEVRRSNEILRKLARTASAHPGMTDRYRELPMHLMARVGEASVAILHGDVDSLAGWAFSQENLLAAPRLAAALLEQIDPDNNRWYPPAIQTAERIELPLGRAIRLIFPPVFIATKLEAFRDRGNSDYLASHDLEDILSVVDGRVELVAEARGSGEELRSYLSTEIRTLLGIADFLDALPGHLPGDNASQQRAPEIMRRLRQLAEIA
ncbi:MAG: hypothetical protein EXR28_16765 [Betaproteobacteria bacterium]|nr:hypothetical protein [Betaproteobacteria bacterium]